MKAGKVMFEKGGTAVEELERRIRIRISGVRK